MNRYIPISAVLLSLVSFQAGAQTNCAPLQQYEEHLRANFSEKPMIEWDAPAVEGLPSRTVRLYGNTESGTITGLVIFEDSGRQIACLRDTGERMRIAPQFKPAEHPL